MTDVFTPEKRSWIMSRVHQRDTKPEMLVRSMIFRMGFRYRLHRRDLPGSPDVVLSRYKKIIFVHGCFWHRHTGCRFTAKPKTRPAFWAAKFKANQQRDRRAVRALRANGWGVMTVWECETRNPERLSRRIARFFDAG